MDVDELWSTYVIAGRPEQLRNAIAEEYLEFVERVARQLTTKRRSYDECFSAGCFGLLQAIPRFDPERGFKPEAFFWHHIRGAILDYSRQLRDVSASRLAKRFKLDEARIKCPSEAAAFLGCTERTAAMIMATSIPRSLDAPIGDDQSSSLGEMIEAPVPTSVKQPDIRPLLEQCDATERRLLELYYFERLPMSQVGKKLGFSTAKISKMHAILLERLRSVGRDKPERKKPNTTSDPVGSALGFLLGGNGSIAEVDKAIGLLDEQLADLRKKRDQLSKLREIMSGLAENETRNTGAYATPTLTSE